MTLSCVIVQFERCRLSLPFVAELESKIFTMNGNELKELCIFFN